MKRRSFRRTTRNSSRSARSSRSTTSRSSKTRSKSCTNSTNTSTSTTTYMDELTAKEVRNDLMSDIMTDNNGCHHCLVCNHTFNTRSTQHWIPQWISHKSSKRHQNNKNELLCKMINGVITIARTSNNIESSSEEETEPETESEALDNNEQSFDEQTESEQEETDTEYENEQDIILKQKPKKRLKLTLNKSKQKTRYKVNCPYCHTFNMVQLPLQNFQLKHCVCVSHECNKKYWIQIKDNQPIITKQYPFMSQSHATNTNKKLKLKLNRKRKQPHSDSDSAISNSDYSHTDSDIQILSLSHSHSHSHSPPRKKLKMQSKNNNNNNNNNINIREQKQQTQVKYANSGGHDHNNNNNNNNEYYDSETDCVYQIPNEDILFDNKNENEGDNMYASEHDIFNSNMYSRPYSSQLSHIEMLDDCSRSLCSDFISGNCHCWEAVPLILPGNICMAQIGYVFECIWCEKQISFVEELNMNNTQDIVTGIAVKKAQKQNNIKSIEHQSQQIGLTLYNKWKVSENIPIYTIDGPSYSRVPFSLNNLKIKDRIMASDGTNWLPAWIEKINASNNKVLVHFKGWNSRWDKWYNINSGMLKTINEYRKEKKLHSATRNESIYQIMKQKYPIFTPTTLYETQINKIENKNNKRSNRNRNRNRNNNHHIDAIDAEIVMMHDKNEIFMSVQELPIHNKDNLILCPSLFYSTSLKTTSTCINEKNNIVQLVYNCFAQFKRVLNEKDIQLIYKYCESKIDQVFFTLYCLKTPQRLCVYLKLLKDDNNL